MYKTGWSSNIERVVPARTGVIQNNALHKDLSTRQTKNKANEQPYPGINALTIQSRSP